MYIYNKIIYYFKYQVTQMELIDNHIRFQQSQQCLDSVLVESTDQFNNMSCSSCLITDEKIEIFGFCLKNKNKDLYSKISWDKSRLIKFRYMLINQTENNALNLNSKSTLLRYILKQNAESRVLNCIVNPSNGQLTFLLIIQQYLQITSIQNMIELANISFQRLKLFFQAKHKILVEIFNERKQIIQNSNQKVLETIKRIAVVAPYYAWNMLKHLTQSKQKDSIKQNYNQCRQVFLQRERKFKSNPFIADLTSSHIKSIEYPVQQLTILTLEEEKQLKSSYLAKLNTNDKSNLINQITITEENLRKLFRDKVTKIESYQRGQLILSIMVYPKEMIPALTYEMQLITKLPNEQYMGMPKYYIIKNFRRQTQHCIITNLDKGLYYKEYLLKNANTISLSTKLYLLHQSSLILKYLASHKILYHNLNPYNLWIKKSMIVKATKLFNGFHYELPSSNNKKMHSPCKNILPYSTPAINRNYGDEKSDVYSLGMLIYQTIFGRPLFHISKTRSEEFWIKKILKPQLIAHQKIQKQGDFGLEGLLYTSLQSIKFSNPQTQDSEDQVNSEYISISKRPYLDWIVIILKFISENYRKKFN